MDFDIVFITGPQGSGKGTQGQRLAKKLDFLVWDMGAMLRQILAENHSPLAEKVAVINQGIFLTDEVIIEVVQDRLKTLPPGKGIIFDGLPRRMGQAKFLMDFLHSQNRKGYLTIFIDLPREESMKRLELRAKIEGRLDDTPEAIEKRLEFFEEVIRPMMEYLKEETTFIEIDGRPSIDEVTGAINSALGI